MGEAAQSVTSERWDSIEGELAMERGHMPAWKAMINQIAERDITQAQVLDYGCNRGGFLRALHAAKPFKSGLGVDIALEALNDARRLAQVVPVKFEHSDALKTISNQFDLAFSHEVVYLLPDMVAHAREIHKALKPGGVYYLAIGEYAENPLWPRWDNVVREFSPVPPQTYSLQYIAKTFQTNGFNVGVTKLRCDGFFDYDAMDGKYLQSPIELVEFMQDYMMYFRMQKAV